MKKLILAGLFLVGAAGLAQAAAGSLAYEVAVTSITERAVTVSSTTPTLISKTIAQSYDGEGGLILWYEITLFNVAASSGVYGFSNSATTAPGLTCSNGARIGQGTVAAPYVVTEHFQLPAYMWALDCNTEEASFSLPVVHRGR